MALFARRPRQYLHAERIASPDRAAIGRVGTMTCTDDAISRFTCIIPAGGVGSRLWPLSRANAPKFLLDLTGSGTSLLRATGDRLTRPAPTASWW